MQVFVNDKTVEVKEATSISSLLEQMGLNQPHLAVALNDEVVPRSLHVTKTVNEGDRILIVQAVGGG